MSSSLFPTNTTLSYDSCGQLSLKATSYLLKFANEDLEVKSKTKIAPWQPRKYCLVIAVNCSYPAVSQIYNLTAMSSTLRVTDFKSTPIVASPSSWKDPSTNLFTSEVFPDADEPTRIILKVLSYAWRASCYNFEF